MLRFHLAFNCGDDNRVPPPVSWCSVELGEITPAGINEVHSAASCLLCIYTKDAKCYLVLHIDFISCLSHCFVSADYGYLIGYCSKPLFITGAQ